jgi:hypothetical protein
MKINTFTPCLTMEYSYNGQYVRVSDIAPVIQRVRNELGYLRRDAMNTIATMPDEELIAELDALLSTLTL